MSMYVTIEGLIGAGKTTLCKALAQKTEFFGPTKLQLEPAEGENPYLELYYKNPERYAFNMQIYLLGKRYRSHLAAQSLVLNGDYSVIADRSYFGDRCFAEIQKELGYFSEADFNTYISLHKDMQRDILYPSAIIYIKAPIETSMMRIARRQSEIEGRQCECAITRDYMEKLDNSIDKMINSLCKYIPVLDLNPLDQDGKERNTEDLCNTVMNYLRHVKTIHNPYDAWQGVL